MECLTEPSDLQRTENRVPRYLKVATRLALRVSPTPSASAGGGLQTPDLGERNRGALPWRGGLCVCYGWSGALIGYVVIKLDRGVYFLIVDLMDPTRAVSATLDGPVLAVLAQAGKPLTVGQVAALTPRGSEIGVRRSLARLVEQGIVRATEMGRNRVHELNRDHVAAPVAEALAGLRLALWARFRAALSGWNPRPVYGCVFGSAARGDGDAHSDIDVLLVRPPVAGESDPRRNSAGLAESLAGYASELRAVPLTERQAAKWDRQVGDLHDLVRGWTGNRLQVVEMSAYQWADHRRRRTPLFEDISLDAIQVAGETSWASPAPARAR